MASHNWHEFQYALERYVTHLFGLVSFGASGAPTLDTTNSKGITSVTRTSAGLFVITLDGTYRKLLDAGWIFKLAAGSFPAAPNCQVTADTLTTTATVTIQFSNTAGNAATDPANGEKVYLHLVLAN